MCAPYVCVYALCVHGNWNVSIFLLACIGYLARAFVVFFPGQRAQLLRPLPFPSAAADHVLRTHQISRGPIVRLMGHCLLCDDLLSYQSRES